MALLHQSKEIAGMVRQAAAVVGDVDPESKKLQVTPQDVLDRLTNSKFTAITTSAPSTTIAGCHTTAALNKVAEEQV